MTPNQRFAQSVRNRMFADRKTLDEAMEYAYSVARGTDNPAAVMTAVMVVVNTLVNLVEKLETDQV